VGAPIAVGETEARKERERETDGKMGARSARHLSVIFLNYQSSRFTFPLRPNAVQIHNKMLKNIQKRFHTKKFHNLIELNLI